MIERDWLDGLHLADSRFDEGDDVEANPDRGFWNMLPEQGDLRGSAAPIVPDDEDVEAAPRDPDLGFLAPEANEAALIAALGHLRVAHQLMLRDGGGGAILGRIRTQNDALAASASDLPGILSANRRCSVSTPICASALPQRKARSASRGSCPVSGMRRSRIARPSAPSDLNRPDPDRILRIRRALTAASRSLAGADRPGIPANRNAAGRRELDRLPPRIMADLAVPVDEPHRRSSAPWCSTSGSVNSSVWSMPK